MLYPIPSIGAKGIYTLSAPFNTLVLPDDEYTCMAVRNINDYIANNEDILNIAYIPNGLTNTDYNNDLAVNMSIVSLQSQVGHWLYVPARFITKYPSSEGIPYHNVVIGVNIGAVPVALDLTFLNTAISNVVHDNLGITPEIKDIEVSKVISLPVATDTQIKTARLAVVGANTTDTAKYRNMSTAYAAALAKITALEAYILANRVKLGI